MKQYSVKQTTSAVLLICGSVLLAGCQTDSPAQPEQSAAPTAAPNTGFSPDVTPVALDACRAALAKEAQNSVIDVTGSEFSQANSVVYLALGPQRAPWRCLVSNDGRVEEIMFMGSEGAL